MRAKSTFTQWVRRAAVLAGTALLTVAGPTVNAAAAPDEDSSSSGGSYIDAVIAEGGQRATLIVYSESMRKMIPITVLRPADTSQPRPTFYLLNGAGGGEDSATWEARTEYSKFFKDKNVNVVTPIGGAFSYYTDWQKDDPVLGRNKWTTFLTEELPPLIDKQFSTTGTNAIAGISMAGTSVLNLAIAAPRLYKSVAAYSGCARTSDALGQAYIRLVVSDRGRGNLSNMWGPIGSEGWRAHDPYINAAKLRETKVYMTSGTGIPGEHDQLNADGVDGNLDTLINQVAVGGVIEAAVNNCTQQMAARMKSLDVDHEVFLRPNGSHSWGYWEDDLHNTWPKIAADLGLRESAADDEDEVTSAQ